MSLDHTDLDPYIDKPHSELPAEVVDALDLDSTGCDGTERFPYTWANLTDAERQRVRQLIRSTTSP